MPLTPNQRARRQAIADTLILLWFIATGVFLAFAWFTQP